MWGKNTPLNHFQLLRIFAKLFFVLKNLNRYFRTSVFFLKIFTKISFQNVNILDILFIIVGF